MAGHLVIPAGICGPGGKILPIAATIRLHVFPTGVINVVIAVITAPGD